MDAGVINQETGVPCMMSTSYQKVVNALEDSSTEELWDNGYTLRYNERYFMVEGKGVVRIGEMDSDNRGRIIWSMEYNSNKNIVESTPHAGVVSSSGVPLHSVTSVLKASRFSTLYLLLARRSKHIKNTDVYTDGRHALLKVSYDDDEPMNFYEELTEVGKDWYATFNGDSVELYNISLPEFLLDTI